MKKNILLVEYDLETSDNIREFMHHEAAEITVAGDASSAKALLEKQDFQLVVTEALLPKSHGFTLCKYIYERYPGTRVIIIGDKHAMKDYKREAARYGACEFVEKPLNYKKFKKKILNLLDIGEETKNNETNGQVNTNIFVLPPLDELKAPAGNDNESNGQSEAKNQPGKKEKTDSDKFKNVIEEVKKSQDSYKIDLE
jgi:DNA-binding NtrC family response regulator